MKKLILFIHGLGGHGKGTWQNKQRRTGFFDLINENKELNSQYAVAYYSYPTSLFRWPFFSKSPKIQTLANALRTQINNIYAEYESIILVCHSLGGLIARKYLIDEVQNGRTLKVNKLLLYAVPNNGAQLASVGKYLSWKHNHLGQLSKDSDLVEFLNEEWFRLRLGDRLSIKYVVAGLDRIVDEQSAKSFWGNPDIDTIIDRGHIDVVKPTSREDTSFVILKKFVDETPISVAIDLSHKQREQGEDGWRGFPHLATGLSKALPFIEPGSLKNKTLLGRVSTLVLALPYQSPFTDEEAINVRMWVNSGGGLFLMGYYAADTHHKSNPSRIAREFGFEFRDDLVLPTDALKDDYRRHVFQDDRRFSVQVDVSDSAGHPILNGIKKLAFMSSCSIKTEWGSNPHFILNSPPTSKILHPEGPKGPEGWSRKLIQKWVLDRADAAPLLVAFSYGKGRVVLSGTWKLCTLLYDDNAKLVDNILQWLSTKSI